MLTKKLLIKSQVFTARTRIPLKRIQAVTVLMFFLPTIFSVNNSFRYHSTAKNLKCLEEYGVFTAEQFEEQRRNLLSNL